MPTTHLSNPYQATRAHHGMFTTVLGRNQRQDLARHIHWEPKGYPQVLGTNQVPGNCFISFEPLHDRIDCNFDLTDLMKIDWVIIGGESGNETGKYRYRPCKVEWIEELIADFSPMAKIFVKQMGTHLAKEMGMSDRHGGNIEEFPEHLRIRKFPNDVKSFDPHDNY